MKNENAAKTAYLEQIMTANPNLSLKRIALETNTCYQYLLKASKKPVANQIYDATAINYSEVERIIKKHSDLLDFDWSAIAETCQNRQIAEKLEIDENTVFSIRGNSDAYVMIYKTNYQIVIKDIKSNNIRVMNLATFEHQSPKYISTVEEFYNEIDANEKAKANK